MRTLRAAVGALALAVILSGCGPFLYVWGENMSGQLGDDTTTNRFSPTKLVPTPSWSVVSAGSGHTCGVHADEGGLWCWGGNEFGQLGDGTTTDRHTPTRIGTATDWVNVTAGEFHTCGRRGSGTLWCWGNNDFGQLGDGTTTDRLRPKRIGTATNWMIVAPGSFQTCGLRGGGTLWCWGQNSHGQVGDGTTTDRHTPKRIGEASDWTTVAIGGASCGLRGTGTLWCWGYNEFGQLGDGTTTERHTPKRIGSGTNWTAVATGSFHTCGLRGSGTLWCWGYNEFGQLGDGGATFTQLTPKRIGTASDWTAVTGGYGFTCGLRGAGALWCWGDDYWGQVGDGGGLGDPPRWVPTHVGTATDWTTISAGGAHAVALKSS